jgi:uncharacterized membrane protein
MNKKIWFGVGILILAGIIYFIFGTNAGITGNVVAEPIQEADVIKIPLSAVSTKAQWFDYNSNGVNIRYYVVQAKDGSVKTAFDACDVCYRSKKGYRQSGGDMICNNCGNYYPISGLGTKNLKGGGCWPGYLPRDIEGDYIVIKKSDLEAGRYRF